MFIKSTDVLNAIISGEPITVERKFQDPIEITPRAKLLWAMNELPRVQEAGNGLFRRVKVVEFPALAEGRKDPALKEGSRQRGRDSQLGAGWFRPANQEGAVCCPGLSESHYRWFQDGQ